MVIPNLRELYSKAFEGWVKDNATRLSAALAFYAMLSLSPTLVLAVAISSRVLGSSHEGMHVVHLAEGYLGKSGSAFLETLIQTSARPGTSIIASLLSLGVAMFGASNLFAQLNESVNSIWNANPWSPGIKGFVVSKAVSILMFIAFAMLFVTWLALDSWVGWIEAHTPGFQGWAMVSFVVSLLFLTLVFAAAFRAIPHGMVAWGDVWIGAITTAFGFAVSKFLLSLYFSYSTVSAAYGSAGALVIILLWIYYSAQIFFFGIEITCAYAHMHGSQAHRHKGEPPIPVPQNT